MKSSEIRNRFLKYFESQGHALIGSASLVPENDPTVLFTTAGMQPLVPYLLGEKHPMGKRLCGLQKCIRTQDIDEVGDNRHLTFFEMMGNWSLGDYFKQESINWSFEFLTNKEFGLGLEPSNLYVTVFEGDEAAPRDEESIAIWQKAFSNEGISSGVGVPLSEGGRIFAMSKDSNWWGPAGQSGPCGPDTEIYYDLGERSGFAQVDKQGFPDFESGRLVEIWNNVFMEYLKDIDGSYSKLQQKNVDTGMGFERISAISQGVDTVFETDVFTDIISHLKTVASSDALLSSIYIMADHFRSAVMLILDGVVPSNKERGYVLRRLLRRAILHGQFTNSDWVDGVVGVICGVAQEAYPTSPEDRSRVSQVIKDEASKFIKTLEKGKVEISKREKLSGKEAFDLYQTYGFPLELTKEYAKSKGVSIDEEEFEREFESHKELSRTASAGQFKSGLADDSELTTKYHTATHLLHWALREVLGKGVEQRGSNITAERLRFDFSHGEKVSAESLEEVSRLVNLKIKEGLKVTVEEMTPAEAYEQGAIGLFGHKYGDRVTVYSIEGCSREICTGPHVGNTSEIGTFKIIKEEAVSAGVRRIKAVLE